MCILRILSLGLVLLFCLEGLTEEQVLPGGTGVLRRLAFPESPIRAKDFLAKHKARIEADIAKLKAAVETPQAGIVRLKWKDDEAIELINEKSAVIAKIDEVLKAIDGQEADIYKLALARMDRDDRYTLQNYLYGLKYNVDLIKRGVSDPALAIRELLRDNFQSKLMSKYDVSKMKNPLPDNLDSIRSDYTSRKLSKRTMMDCEDEDINKVIQEVEAGRIQVSERMNNIMIRQCGVDLFHPWREGRMLCKDRLPERIPVECRVVYGNICTNSQGQFLKEAGATFKSPPKTDFEVRLKSTRPPGYQGHTFACVGFSATEELNRKMDDALLFAELSPSFNPFQVYDQMYSELRPNCSKLTGEALMQRVSQNDNGIYYGNMMVKARLDPFCLPGGGGRVKVGKAMTFTGGTMDFDFLHSLTASGQGLMVGTRTEVGIEQENWVRYGCRSGTHHMLYVVGTGRGLNPFTLKSEPYVIVRDSFRGEIDKKTGKPKKVREYNVPYDNFREIMEGALKFDQVSFVPDTEIAMPVTNRGGGPNVRPAAGAE